MTAVTLCAPSPIPATHVTFRASRSPDPVRRPPLKKLDGRCRDPPGNSDAFSRYLASVRIFRPHLAEDLKHKRKVAVKVLRPELAAVLEAERFVQEINTTATDP